MEMQMIKKLILLFAVLQLTSFAAPKNAEQQAANLHTILRHADDAYYNQHHSIMGDAAYDALRGQLDRLIAVYNKVYKK